MGDAIRTVAILVSSPALSSLLAMTLAGAPVLRVRPFETQLALTTYLRLAPVDLIVMDFDSEPARADRLALALRADGRIESKDFQVIALASALTPEIKAASMHSGIDEIVMKPMSPKYLLERTLSRLAKTAARTQVYRGPERRAGLRTAAHWARFGDNVIPLFDRRPQPQV